MKLCPVLCLPLCPLAVFIYIYTTSLKRCQISVLISTLFFVLFIVPACDALICFTNPYKTPPKQMHYSNTVCLIGPITSGKPNTQEFDLTKLINQKEIDYLINSKLLKHFVEEAARLFNIAISCPVTLIVEIIIAVIY